MSGSEPTPEELVEQGLKLYSRGELDRALVLWRRALQLAPGVPRAQEYIRYVEDNRAALVESFKVSTGDHAVLGGHSRTAAGRREGHEAPPAAEMVDIEFGELGGADPGDHSAQEDDLLEFEPETDFEGIEVPQPIVGADVGRQAELVTEVRERADEDALPRIEINEFGDPFAPPGADSDLTSRIHLADYRDQIERSTTRTPDRGSESVSAPLGRELQPTPLVLLPGGGESAEEDFAPEEKTPVGLEVPHPSRVVPGAPAGADDAALRFGVPIPEDELHDEFALDTPTANAFLEEPTPLRAVHDSGAVDQALDGGDGDDVLEVAGEPAGDQEPIVSRLRRAQQRYDQGSYEESLSICQSIVDTTPEHPEAKVLLQRSSTALEQHYEQQIGDLEQVPRVQVPPGEVVWHKLDHRAGFLLSQVDGMLSYSELLDISGMDRFETLRIIAQLLEQGVITSGG